MTVSTWHALFMSFLVLFRCIMGQRKIWTYSASKDTTEFNIFTKDNSGFVPHHLDVNSICNCLTHIHFFSIGTWLYMLNFHWLLGGRGPDFKNCTLTNVPYSDGASSDSYLKWTDVRTEFREIDWFFCTSNLAALLIILFWTAFYLYRSLKGGVLEFETTVTTSEKVKKRQLRCRINRVLDN